MKAFTKNKRRLIISSVILLILLAFLGQVSWNKWGGLFNRQDTLIERDTKQLEDKLKEDPNSPAPKIQLSLLYARQERFAEAETLLKGLIAAEENNQPALTSLGNIYMAQGKYSDAIIPLNKVVDLNKDNPLKGASRELEAVYYSLGNAYMKMNQPEQALASLKEALLIDRTDSDAHFTAGLVYQQQGNHDEAIKEFKFAILFVPNFKEAYQSMAESYKAKAQTSQEEYALAMVSLNSGAFEDARVKLERVVSAIPDYTDAYLGLGMTYEKLGQINKAKESYQKVLQLDPKSWLAQQRLSALAQ